MTIMYMQYNLWWVQKSANLWKGVAPSGVNTRNNDQFSSQSSDLQITKVIQMTYS